MTEVSRVVIALSSDVWDLIADGWTQGGWVTGTSHVYAVDVAWPARGSSVHRAGGAWPVTYREEARVIAVVDGHSLELITRRPLLGQVRVSLRLRTHGVRTRVSMVETPCAGPIKWLDNPVAAGLRAWRTRETLDRLAALAERRSRQPS
jgi:hypothetical protein